MRTLSVDSRLTGHRLHPIGSTGNTLYVKVQLENSVEIWSLNTLFPESWSKIFVVNFIEVYYSFPAFSINEDRIFLMVFGTALSNEDEANIYEVDLHTKRDTIYCLDIAFSANFYSLPFESVCLSHGKTGLHMYDRGIIMEDIPYWNIELQEATFAINRNDIRDSEKLKCDRFPIAVDSGARIFARLLSDKRLVVFMPESVKWQEYIQSSESHFNLCDLDTRGIRETFSRGGGHRAGAVQSPLSIFTDNGMIIAKVNYNKVNHFYRIILNHFAKEFTCIPVGRANFFAGLNQMFYATVTRKSFIAVGIRAVGVVEFQPLSLGECALWALQKSKMGANHEEMFVANETDPWPHPAKFIISMHSSSIGSIGITILASYCILYKSGPMGKTYKILLMIHLMWSACVEFLYNVCVTPVIFVPFKAGYYNGLFEVLHLSPEVTLMFGVLIVCGDIVSILHLFAYRLYSVLPSGNFFRRKWLVNQLFVFFYILTGGYVVALISNAYDTSADRRHIAEEQWGHVPAQIDQWNLIFFSRGLYDHFWSVFFIVLLFTQYFGFSLLATLSAALTFFVIRSHTAMSEQTKRMQRTLTWALVIQVLTFGLCIFVPIFVILLGALVFDFLPIEISDMVVFMMSISGTSDTIALLLITRVYRQAVVNMIKNMLQVPPLKWIFCCVKITSSPGLSAPSSVAPAL